MLDLAGPPFYVTPAAALDEWTLPELLTLWVRTREWERHRQADRLETVSYIVSALGLTARFTKEQSDALDALKGMLHGLTGAADQLRRPEGMARQRLQLTEAQRAFYRGHTLAEESTAAD